MSWYVDIDDDEITLNYGEEGAMVETNHDEVGWAGADLLERVALMLNDIGAHP